MQKNNVPLPQAKTNGKGMQNVVVRDGSEYTIYFTETAEKMTISSADMSAHRDDILNAVNIEELKDKLENEGLFSELNKLTGGTKIANFFYTRTGAGTAVLEICWNWIGIELVYLLPLAVIAVPLFAIYYSPFFIADLINKRKNKKVKNQ